jgi:hypothetical protein
MKVEISPFGGDKRVEEFLDWLANVIDFMSIREFQIREW